MARWLLKTEPDCYAWADLERDRETVWDGVVNALARKHLRSMRRGDEAVIYHTGDERAAVGIARISSDPAPDPKVDDGKSVVVKVAIVRRLPAPVPLSRMKAEPVMAGWDLLRISRLGVVPIPDAVWERLLEIAGDAADRVKLTDAARPEDAAPAIGAATKRKAPPAKRKAAARRR